MRTGTKIFASVLFVLAAAVFSIAQSGDFVEGEVLVKFRSTVDDRRAREVNDRFGARTVDRLGGDGLVRVVLDGRTSTKDAIRRFASLPDVEYAQPNFYYRLQLTPNDPDFTSGGLYGLTKIGAPAAWDLTTGSPNVVVANIDTGIRYTHSDLAPNIWTNPGELPLNGVDDDSNGFIDDYHGWDFRYNDWNPVDENGHGTHTAGTIGAVGNNSLGVVGVNWTVRIMTIKIYSASGQDTTSAMLIAAYQYVLMMKNRGVNIRVTNNSYGGCNEACGYDQATKDAIDALGEAGILNVFAAGNSGVDTDVTPFFPASYTSPSILSVGGSNATDQRAYNYGAVTVDLAAPGVGIRSTYSSTDNSYVNLSGTSMATPHVAGAAALLVARDPSLSAASLKASLMNNVDVLPVFAGFNKTGGRLNASAALQNPTVCTLTGAEGAMTVGTKGGVFTVNVSAPANCDYMARSNASWLKVLNSDTFSGNGTVTFRVRVNPTISRTATLTIGGRTFTVTQRRN
jgi:subtilisin family serine protease